MCCEGVELDVSREGCFCCGVECEWVWVEGGGIELVVGVKGSEEVNVFVEYREGGDVRSEEGFNEVSGSGGSWRFLVLLEVFLDGILDLWVLKWEGVCFLIDLDVVVYEF